MNIKIEAQNLRFKISEDELDTLLNGTPLEAEIQVLGKKFVVMVSPTHDGDEILPQLIMDQRKTCLKLLASPAHLQTLFKMGRNKAGLESNSHGLSVSLQVDLRKHHRQTA